MTLTDPPDAEDAGDPAKVPASHRGWPATTPLMIGATVALLAAVVVLGLAAALPVVVSGPDAAAQPAAWTGYLALPVGAMAAVLLALHTSNSASVARLLAGVSMVLLLLASGYAAWQALPDPGSNLGLGRRIPWVWVGCALGVLATVACTTSAAIRRRSGTDRGTRSPSRLEVCVVTLLVVVAAFGGVRLADEWTQAQNQVIERARGPLDTQSPSDLDGTKRWQIEAGRPAAATRGGIVSAAEQEVTAIDPTTGERRWRFVQRGSSFEGQPVVSPDGRYVAVLASEDNGLTGRITDERYGDAVFVLDARTGGPLAKIDADDREPVYVNGDVVLLGDAASEASIVRAYKYDDNEEWSYDRQSECVLATVVGVGDAVLVGHNCQTGVKVSVRDPVTGTALWDWEHDGHLGPDGVILTGDDTVVLDLTQDFGEYGTEDPDPDTHMVTALDAETGETRWSRDRVQVGAATSDAYSIYTYAGLYTAGTLVLAGSRLDREGSPVELIGLDPSDGSELWRAKVPLDTLRRPSGLYRGLDVVLRAVDERVLVAGPRIDSTADRSHAIQVRSVSARSGASLNSFSVTSPVEVGEVAVYVVDDTVSLRTTDIIALESETKLIGLG